MQKLFAIVFSFLLLFQSLNIGVEDISKINVLLEHAKFHQEKYGDTFFQFLGEHYGDTMVSHQNDHKEHDELPFKHQHQSCTHVSIAYVNETFSLELNYQPFLEIPFNFFYKETSSLFEKPSVFQPPRLA